ncbi:WD-40 repeat protein [Reticulomyxa filosa]|uniref:WD-40 repeat protein n=1 Tax=Reticulomyxa filosa TaxID=46433 RepID=X6P080_RETFI|nr:WD-40 repeat protein [Reticulomyxa filosa]|eukprot:ETO31965.1 WD-40 repeat protein [Reticulomyxa filosa]
MTTLINEEKTLIKQALVRSFRKKLLSFGDYCIHSEEEIQTIIQYWIRVSKIKLGWIQDFDRFVVKYATDFFMFEVFRSLSKLLKTFSGHTKTVWSIDYLILDDCQLLCSGSEDKIICVWDIETNKQIQSFNGHSDWVCCVKFSQYYHHNNHRSVVCSSSVDKTIRFWDIKHNRQLQVFNGHNSCVNGIEFSPFNSGRYLCSGSDDKTIRLWDIETSKSLHIFNGHEHCVWCVDISPLQGNNDNKSNNIGVIGGNGYTICSGSDDKTIRIWDIETTKQSIMFEGHTHWINSVKYEPNESGNTILSGSFDKSVRLWDIRSGQQTQVFNGHISCVRTVEYSPFVVNNIEIGGNSNVICSGSDDGTIRFWDIRSNKSELHIIKGDNKEDYRINCLKFLQLKKTAKEIMIIVMVLICVTFVFFNEMFFIPINISILSVSLIRHWPYQKIFTKYDNSQTNKRMCCFLFTNLIL